MITSDGFSNLAKEQLFFKRLWTDESRSSVDRESPAVVNEADLFARYFSRQSILLPQLAQPSDYAFVPEPSVAEMATVKVDVAPIVVPVEITPVAIEDSLFHRLRKGLQRTRQGLTEGLIHVLQGKTHLDRETREQLETLLLVADVGFDASEKIIQQLSGQLTRDILNDPQQLLACLEQVLFDMVQVKSCSQLEFEQLPAKPYVVLMVGVNGVGKTTTIGKLAKRLQQKGHSVMLAAGDTFRAAAVEQLKVWGERNQIPVIAQDTGADSASVVFDALQAAKARNVDVLIADTAGRLHNKSNLMEELKKVQRVLQKLDPQAPHEIILAIDAGTGQNALNQVQEFNQAVGLTSVILTKLDGTAKGGIAFAICEKFALPVSYIGVGEQLDDLRPFEARAFIQALCSRDSL